VRDPRAKDDPDDQLVLNVLDSDEIHPAVPAEAPAELVDELLRVRAIIQAFDSLGVAPASTPAPAPKWGPFLLKEQVGRGRFGIVCRGFDPAVQRDVAVKLYSNHELPAEPRLMARVRHPNVVTVFGAAVHEDRPGIWMEFIHGQTLGHRVEVEGPLSPQEVQRIGIALCDALTAVHGAQLVHQDIKARNVMQEDSGRVVLMDFGAGLPSAQGAAPERLSGTPVYMAPEVVLGARPTVESDVYSLGVLLYYLLTGTYPVYAPDIEDLRRLHERHHRAGTRRFVATLRELRPEVSPALARCLARALASTGHRYKTAGEFEVALEAVRLGLLERPRRRAGIAGTAAAILAAGFAAGYWLARPPAPHAVVLQRITRDAGLTIDPALSRDGKLLAYASDRGGQGNLDIWIQQMAGGEPLRLTRDSADESQPSFSPDGSTIAFRSERANGGLYVVSALGGEPRLIAEKGRWPRFSPDGHWIAYVTGRSLLILPPTGGPPREIRTQGAIQSAPVWSPDGRYLLVVETEVDDRPLAASWEWWFVPIDASPAIASGMRALTPENAPTGTPAWWPVPSTWVADRILFDTPHGDVTNLWEVHVLLNSHRVVGPLRRLLASTESQFQPLLDPSGRLIFSTQTGVPYIAEVDLDATDGRARGPVRSVMPRFPSHGMHATSRDGRWLAFASSRLGHSAIWLRDLNDDSEHPVTLDDGDHNFPVLSANGQTLAYSVRKDESVQTYLLDTSHGTQSKLCDCGPPTDMSPDSRYVLVQHDALKHASLDLLDLSTRARTTIFTDSDYTIYRGHFSPDGRWVVFHTADAQGALREFVAPFHDTLPALRREWIPITDGTATTDAPRWSPDGRLIYYVSDRDGFRCIWAQRLDSATKQPIGPPVPVQHFHSRHQAIANMNLFAIDLALARDKLFFNIGELKGNIWSADFH
jgi:Tol biopolymer transport system component